MKSQILIIFLFLALALWGAGCDKNKSPTSPKKEPVNGNNTPPDIQYVTHPQTDIPWPTLADSPCPIANYNPQRVARSKYKGPKKGRVKWKLPMSGKATHAPVVGVDGTIYVTAWADTNGDKLFAVSSEGDIIWEFTPPLQRQKIDTSPIINADNNIIIATKYYSTDNPKGVLYVLNMDGSIKSEKELPIRIICRGGLIDLEGNLYFTGYKEAEGPAAINYLYSFTIDGTERWHISNENIFNPYSYISMSPDGSVLYIHDEGSNVYAISPNDGTILWRNAKANRYCSAPIVDSDGNIYTYYKSSGEYGIVSYDPEGTFRWKFDFKTQLLKSHDSLSDYFSEMCLNHNGFIYCYYGDRLVSFDYISQKRWFQDLPSSRGDGETPVTCDVDGTIYLTGGSYLYAYNQKGEMLFECKFTDYHAYAGSLACDGVAYILDAAAILIAVE